MVTVIRHHCAVSIPLPDWLWGVILSSNFIPDQWCHITAALVYCCFCCIYLFTPIGCVQPLVATTDYTKSTFLRENIIAIYDYFLHDPYHLDCTVSHYPDILFRRNIAVLTSSWFIVFCCCCIYLFTPSRRAQILVQITEYTNSSFWEIMLLLYIIISYVTFIVLVLRRHIL